ncbi:MAG: DedA family protein [Spirochaetae bacterium HGW-Spirochaetae-1]|nr:MAG: DedA family protein [Spirochaetae bacterium HGW-Spirochaetae-1]
MSNINYGTVIFLMAVESSFIPFPSEVVIPPAGWKAAQGEMNLLLVIVAGTVGSMIGALFNYYLAILAGRKIIYAFVDTRLARALMLSREGVEKAELFFNRYGNISTFTARLIPAVRQLISIPAGLARMPLKNFLLYTLAGSLTWNIILGLMGYFLYSQKELLEEYYRELTYAGIFLALAVSAYILWSAMRKKSGNNSTAD